MMSRSLGWAGMGLGKLMFPLTTCLLSGFGIVLVVTST